MKYRYTGLLFLATLFFAGISWATPQLGQWELLFSNDDGRAVALDVYRETPVILDKNGHIYFLNKEIGKEATGDWFGEVYESWQKVSGGGVAMDISIDGDGVPWVVGLRSNKIYHLDSNFASPNSGWLEYPGNGKAKRISVSRENGIPYIIGAVSGRIFKGEKNGWTALSGKLLDSSGTDLPNTLKAQDLYAMSYSATGNDKGEWHDLVFAINEDKRVFLYAPIKEAWLELPGNARASAVIASGKLVYIIGEDNKFYGLDLAGAKEWSIAAEGTGKDLAFSQVDIFQPFLTQSGKKIPSSTHRHVWTISEKGQVLRTFVAY
ncbi:MAG: hypothetical protein U9N50_11065 [Pseudomonadota bacterium]|nr:hypothetical protein [Pseudomonadota bacterium]